MFFKKIPWQKTEVSIDGTHHLYENIPLYTKRFKHVLKFHAPGLAPVQDESGWYHITIKGQPAYQKRFHRAFGFYENRAAVETKEGSFHILPSGKSLYDSHYLWCGNYQEGRCVVKENHQHFFHIDLNGKPIYSEKYIYAGDFKDGYAVITTTKGSTHINKNGHLTHKKFFDDLDVFHKGFARAKDRQGWFHINQEGYSIYPQRYLELEPFYNGIARAKEKNGAIVLINENGTIVNSLLKAPKNSAPDFINEISTDLIGFWKIWALKTAVDLKLFDLLPHQLAAIKIPKENLERLLRSLWEMGYVAKNKSHGWTLTKKGTALSKDYKNGFLQHAAHMWAKVNESWITLPQLIKNKSLQKHPSFKECETKEYLKKTYLEALDGYNFDSLKGYDIFLLKQYTKIAFFGRASLPLIEKLLSACPEKKITLYGDEFSLFYINPHLKKKIKTIYLPQGASKIDLENFDAICFVKYLHYFPDPQVTQLLNNAFNSLQKKGSLHIIEMILEDNSPNGALLDLNMLCETGGSVRTKTQWEILLNHSKKKIERCIEHSPLIKTLIIK